MFSANPAVLTLLSQILQIQLLTIYSMYSTIVFVFSYLIINELIFVHIYFTVKKKSCFNQTTEEFALKYCV